MGLKGGFIFCVFVLFATALYSISAFADEAANQAKCESWLEDHYQNFSRLSVVHEYAQDGEYHLRANYNVQPYYGAFTSIGFDCTIYLDSGKVVAFPDLKTFKQEEKINSSLNSLAKHRLSSGGNACEQLSTWQSFADEMHRGNFSAQLPETCSWLEKGQVVLGPIKTVKYKGNGFVLVALPSGEQRWIEDVNL